MQAVLQEIVLQLALSGLVIALVAIPLCAAPNGTVTNAMCYNQFNARGQRKELPNLGAPDGWGIGQIDRSRNGLPAMNYTTTREVYDWHENVAAMNAVLRRKRNRYLEIVHLFRMRYQNDPTTHWVEPNVTTNINGVVLSARQWSIMTLYNGAAGCQPLTVLDRPRERSPIFSTPRHQVGIFLRTKTIMLRVLLKIQNWRRLIDAHSF